MFVAEAEPLGWRLAGFNDTGWPACRVGGAPAIPLVMSELPPLDGSPLPVFRDHACGGRGLGSGPPVPGRAPHRGAGRGRVCRALQQDHGRPLRHQGQGVQGRAGVPHLERNQHSGRTRVPVAVAGRGPVLREPRLLRAGHDQCTGQRGRHAHRDHGRERRFSFPAGGVPRVLHL